MHLQALTVGLLAALLWILSPAVATAATGLADVAGLQVALRAAGTYAGTVDGIAGPGTAAALRAVQQRAALPVDGIAGPATLRALGAVGQHAYASRTMRAGDVGRDVAALQFKLAAHGFPSGSLDGGFGPRLSRALQAFQRRAALTADAVAGPATVRALAAPPPRSPVRLFPPVDAAATDGFGPRGAGFHAGLDYPAPAGTPVRTAGFGTVTFAGFSPSGWGNVVIVRHRFGLNTLYAHLSQISVGAGQPIGARVQLGRVGATGHATGPHLHFEVLSRGANVDPASAVG